MKMAAQRTPDAPRAGDGHPDRQKMDCESSPKVEILTSEPQDLPRVRTAGLSENDMIRPEKLWMSVPSHV